MRSRCNKCKPLSAAQFSPQSLPVSDIDLRGYLHGHQSSHLSAVLATAKYQHHTSFAATDNGAVVILAAILVAGTRISCTNRTIIRIFGQSMRAMSISSLNPVVTDNHTGLTTHCIGLTRDYLAWPLISDIYEHKATLRLAYFTVGAHPSPPAFAFVTSF